MYACINAYHSIGFRMLQSKRTTMAITAERKHKLELIAINLSVKLGKQILWTDLVNQMIDDLINKSEAQ
jgi:hypothetical protein